MNRADQLIKLKNTAHWDIVVIGGGATGLGTALDAAGRGFKTLCIEKHDFSSGTSSRSTKLIHGGVRYLEQGNISMVRNGLFERWFFLKNAPVATRRIPFILPVYSWWRLLYYGFGLFLYDVLSGKYSIGKTNYLSKKAVIAAIPEIRQEKLKGGIRYFDGQFDDSQICLALARTTIGKGGTVVNHMEAEGFIYNGEKLTGVKLRDRITGETFTITAGAVINATGVFADELMQKDDHTHRKIITPSQGIHIVADKKFYTSKEALLIPKTTDGRILFAVPWHGRVLLGTTDIKVESTAEEPVATDEEIHFVLDNFNSYTRQHMSVSDIKSVFAGHRPLVKTHNLISTASLLRDHTVLVSHSGLVTITGGKWTTYRKMSRDAVNKAIAVSGLPFRRCRTKNQKLDLGPGRDHRLSAVSLHPDFTYTEGDVITAVRENMACTLEDVLARRLRMLFLDARAALQCAGHVCRIMQLELGKDDNWTREQLSAFDQLAKKYLPSSDLLHER